MVVGWSVVDRHTSFHIQDADTVSCLRILGVGNSRVPWPEEMSKFISCAIWELFESSTSKVELPRSLDISDLSRPIAQISMPKIDQHLLHYQLMRFEINMATCLPKELIQIIVDYWRETFDWMKITYRTRYANQFDTLDQRIINVGQEIAYTGNPYS